MKRHFNSLSGVTLLEIMLVLAIAAMIIVMSVRYYQNATNSSNVNVLLGQMQNIQAAADSLASPTGSYSGSLDTLGDVVGARNLISPYNTPIVVTATGANTYTVALSGLPATVCTAITVRLVTSGSKWSDSTACNGGAVTFTYNSTT